MQIYYLGPKGTFSYLASQKFVNQNQIQHYDFVPKANLYEVIKYCLLYTSDAADE